MRRVKLSELQAAKRRMWLHDDRHDSSRDAFEGSAVVSGDGAPAGRLAGIEKRVYRHGLRHSFAAELRKEGVDIAIISRQLGHWSISTTAVYLNHIAPYAVIEAMRGRTWAEPRP